MCNGSSFSSRCLWEAFYHGDSASSTQVRLSYFVLKIPRKYCLGFTVSMIIVLTNHLTRHSYITWLSWLHVSYIILVFKNFIYLYSWPSRLVPFYWIWIQRCPHVPFGKLCIYYLIYKRDFYRCDLGILKCKHTLDHPSENDAITAPNKKHAGGPGSDKHRQQWTQISLKQRKMGEALLLAFKEERPIGSRMKVAIIRKARRQILS